jgi:hypothetical protein
MRLESAWRWLGAACLWLAPALPARAVEAIAVHQRPQIDGILVEWGAPERIAIAPGGPQVGVRGAFSGGEDHEADLYLMWDAQFLYAALAVVDDVADVEWVAPGEHVWQGPAGERQDKMFYYDHLKVFLRGPEQALGYNAWVAPTYGARGPYVWGGRQQAPALENLPVLVGSARKEKTYTYELAFPWSWLEVHPQPEMELEALFLLPDGDLPGLEVRQKVAQGNKWVWWQGKIQLKGEPPGLKAPSRRQVVEEIERAAQAIALPEIRPRQEPQAQEVAVAQEEETAKPEPAEEGAAVKGGEALAKEEQTQPGPTMPALRAQLNRQRLARQALQEAPDWVRALNQDQEVSAVQVDSLYHRLKTTLQRLAESRINSRTDGLVMDMAEYAGTWRTQAQTFLQRLLAALIADVGERDGQARRKIVEAAAEAGVEAQRAIELMGELCRQALKVYEEGKVAASDDLIDRARHKAGLSLEEARALLAILVRDWGA